MYPLRVFKGLPMLPTPLNSTACISSHMATYIEMHEIPKWTRHALNPQKSMEKYGANYTVPIKIYVHIMG